MAEAESINGLKLNLSREEADFRDRVRTWFAEHVVGEFADRRIRAAQGTEHWDVRVAWERQLADAGLLNITWPPEYGGRGGTLNEEIVFLVEFARAEAPYWVGNQGRDLFGPTLLRFGTEEQKARFLPAISRADEFWGQGFSEPEAGSDLASLRTRAVLEGDEWHIDGQKTWMSSGMYADWLYVLCRTDQHAAKHQGISLLVIPRHQVGVEVRPIRNVRGTGEFCEVFFEDARTEADLVVGGLNGGWRVAMGALPQERLVTTLPRQLRFSNEFQGLVARLRARGDTSDALVRQALARAWEQLQVHYFLLNSALATIMGGGEIGETSSLAKLSWASWHRSFGELAVSLLGAESLIVGDDYALDADQVTFLQSRAETIYGGTNEIQKNILGERVLGLARDPR